MFYRVFLRGGQPYFTECEVQVSMTFIEAFTGSNMYGTYYLLKSEATAGSKQEKEYVRAVYCHPAYLTYMQSAS